MYRHTQKYKHSLWTRLLAFLVISSFSLNSIAPSAVYAQTMFSLPAVGTMVMPSAPYAPTVMLGMTLHPENPLQIDFMIDRGDDQLDGPALHEESQKLLSYFYASMTVPEEEMWVNLSPYEETRIMADGLGQTLLGRDLLAQDYMLKQLSASMAYPEEEMGQQFWQRVRQKVQQEFGSADIPMNTFNKIWIVPDTAKVYVHETSVFVVENHLKVMLEEDYLALEHNSGQVSAGDAITGVTNEIVREILIPEIEYEVNYGKHFAPLRQMFHAMVLATWYKQNLRSSILTQAIANQNKTEGINLDDPAVIQNIYDQYVKAFEVGVYDYIKEEMDTATQEMIPRKYFSGGVKAQVDVDATALTPAATQRLQKSDLALVASEIKLQGASDAAKATDIVYDFAMNGEEFERFKKEVRPAVLNTFLMMGLLAGAPALVMADDGDINQFLNDAYTDAYVLTDTDHGYQGYQEFSFGERKISPENAAREIFRSYREDRMSPQKRLVLAALNVAMYALVKEQGSDDLEKVYQFNLASSAAFGMAAALRKGDYIWDGLIEGTTTGSIKFVGEVLQTEWRKVPAGKIVHDFGVSYLNHIISDSDEFVFQTDVGPVLASFNFEYKSWDYQIMPGSLASLGHTIASGGRFQLRDTLQTGYLVFERDAFNQGPFKGYGGYAATNIIVLDPELRGNRRASVLRHEIAHGAQYRAVSSVGNALKIAFDFDTMVTDRFSWLPEWINTESDLGYSFTMGYAGLSGEFGKEHDNQFWEWGPNKLQKDFDDENGGDQAMAVDAAMKTETLSQGQTFSIDPNEIREQTTITVSVDGIDRQLRFRKEADNQFMWLVDQGEDELVDTDQEFRFADSVTVLFQEDIEFENIASNSVTVTITYEENDAAMNNSLGVLGRRQVIEPGKIEVEIPRSETNKFLRRGFEDQVRKKGIAINGDTFVVALQINNRGELVSVLTQDENIQGLNTYLINVTVSFNIDSEKPFVLYYNVEFPEGLSEQAKTNFRNIIQRVNTLRKEKVIVKENIDQFLSASFRVKVKRVGSEISGTPSYKANLVFSEDGAFLGVGTIDQLAKESAIISVLKQNEGALFELSVVMNSRRQENGLLFNFLEEPVRNSSLNDSAKQRILDSLEGANKGVDADNAMFILPVDFIDTVLAATTEQYQATNVENSQNYANWKRVILNDEEVSDFMEQVREGEWIDLKNEDEKGKLQKGFKKDYKTDTDVQQVLVGKEYIGRKMVDGKWVYFMDVYQVPHAEKTQNILEADREGLEAVIKIVQELHTEGINLTDLYAKLNQALGKLQEGNQLDRETDEDVIKYLGGPIHDAWSGRELARVFKEVSRLESLNKQMAEATFEKLDAIKQKIDLDYAKIVLDALFEQEVVSRLSVVPADKAADGAMGTLEAQDAAQLEDIQKFLSPLFDNPQVVEGRLLIADIPSDHDRGSEYLDRVVNLLRAALVVLNISKVSIHVEDENSRFQVYLVPESIFNLFGRSTNLSDPQLEGLQDWFKGSIGGTELQKAVSTFIFALRRQESSDNFDKDSVVGALRALAVNLKRNNIRQNDINPYIALANELERSTEQFVAKGRIAKVIERLRRKVSDIEKEKGEAKKEKMITAKLSKYIDNIISTLKEEDRSAFTIQMFDATPEDIPITQSTNPSEVDQWKRNIIQRIKTGNKGILSGVVVRTDRDGNIYVDSDSAMNAVDWITDKVAGLIFNQLNSDTQKMIDRYTMTVMNDTEKKNTRRDVIREMIPFGVTLTSLPKEQDVTPISFSELTFEGRQIYEALRESGVNEQELSDLFRAYADLHRVAFDVGSEQGKAMSILLHRNDKNILPDLTKLVPQTKFNGPQKYIDPAMYAPDYGGIDFNANHLDLTVNGEDFIQFDGPAFDINPADIRGVLPVIINISPMTNLPLLLGLSREEDFESLSKL